MTKSITNAERRATIDEIVASFGLEGIVHSDEELALMERYVEGDISAAELRLALDQIPASR